MNRVAESYSFGLPRKVEGIDGDAVPTQARTRGRRVKTEWFVLAASITSQMSRSIRSKSTFISLTSAILTPRDDVLQKLGPVSAARVDQTVTTRSITWLVCGFPPIFRQSGVDPPNDFRNRAG